MADVDIDLYGDDFENQYGSLDEVCSSRDLCVPRTLFVFYIPKPTPITVEQNEQEPAVGDKRSREESPTESAPVQNDTVRPSTSSLMPRLTFSKTDISHKRIRSSYWPRCDVESESIQPKRQPTATIQRANWPCAGRRFWCRLHWWSSMGLLFLYPV